MLARIRAALGHPRSGDGGRKRRCERAMASPERRLLPQRAERPPAGRIEDFERRLRAQAVSVEAVADANGVPGVIARILIEESVPQVVHMGDDPYFASMPWRAAGLEVQTGPVRAGVPVALSRALAGIAETGTVLLASGAGSPVTLIYLPELHVVTVREVDVVGGLEDAFDRARAELGAGGLPRTLNFVSGASRTGDIGGRLVMGAHGPRRLVVLLVRNAKGAAKAP